MNHGGERCDGGCLQLGLDTNGLAGSINVGGGERGGGEVTVAAAHGVGGGSAGGDEAGEDGCGADDGRHFEMCVWLVVGWLVVDCEDAIVCVVCACSGR
jgi:hypothetical protein